VSLRNFQVNGNVTDADLLKRSDGFLRTFVASFRQLAANGNFTFGPVKLQDADLNRVHGIVTEIDARRLFYACGDDEVPRYAMQSLYETRKAIRETTKGVWANPSCERLVQDISAALSDFCTRAEKLDPENAGSWSLQDRNMFYFLMTDMRLTVWNLVAMLKRNWDLSLIRDTCQRKSGRPFPARKYSCSYMRCPNASVKPHSSYTSFNSRCHHR
jgi:hypothetical protein